MPKHGELCPVHTEIDCYTDCPFDCLYCVERHTWSPDGVCPFPDTLLAAVASNRKRHPLYLSPRTDPYPPREKHTGLTRLVLEEAVALEMPFFVITKSPLVLRDVDLFKGRESFIAVSLNSLDDTLAARLEPGAPTPSERRVLVEILSEIKDVRTVVKIDPVLPGLTDGSVLDDLLKWLTGVRPFAVTAETARLSADSLKFMTKRLPDGFLDPLLPWYRNAGTEPVHPDPDYRLPLFRHIENRLESAGIPVSFCRATIPEPINSRDCRGGFG